MARTPKSKRKRVPKTILKLPDLEQSKSAVLNSLTSSGGYHHPNAAGGPRQPAHRRW